jgi:branched-chain amino acid transport system permease protein
MTAQVTTPVRSRISPRLPFLLATVAVLCTGPWWMKGGVQHMMAEFLIYLALAQLWNLLAGYAGLISIGQQAFVGLGGYALFSLAILLDVPVLLALPLAGVFAALVAFPTALVAFRLSGPHFAIGTWVIAEVFRLTFAQIGALGGGSGTSLPAGIVKTISSERGTREDIIYWLVLATSLIVVGGVWGLMRSRIGLGLAAMRDDDMAAQSAGVVTNRLKFTVYIITAGLTGVLGALIFLQKLRISPEAAFSVNDWTVFVIFMVVIGGIGTLEGPILGCIVFFVLREFFSDFGTWYMIGLGALSVAVMIFAPKGLWGLIASRTEFRLFPVTRKPPGL